MNLCKLTVCSKYNSKLPLLVFITWVILGTFGLYIGLRMVWVFGWY